MIPGVLMRSLEPVDPRPLPPSAADSVTASSPARPPFRPGPPRRRVLGLGALLGLLTVGALSGCQDAPAAAPIPLEADEIAVNRAVTAARSLRSQALALARTDRGLRVLLHRVAAVHEA